MHPLPRAAGSTPPSPPPPRRLPSPSAPAPKNTVNTFACRLCPTPRWLAHVILLAALAGCAAPKPAGSGPGAVVGTEPMPGTAPAPARPPPPAPVASPLVSEQRWLDEWFRGTPVVIALTDTNTLAVDVPLANSFDAGRSSIKPALAAVLDRVATSLRRQPAMRVSIAAPSDAAGAPALASARAQQVRAHLVSRGIAATRMSGVGTARVGAPVQLRLLIAPQAIGHLDDATLPVPAQHVKPASAAPASGVKR